MSNDPMSLFSSGSASPRKKRPKSAETPALTLKKPEIPEEPLFQGPLPKEMEETARILDNIRTRQEEIQAKVTAILSQGYLLPLELQDLLKDYSNWPIKQQAEIMRKANAMVTKVNEAIGAGTIKPMGRKQEKRDAKRSQKVQRMRGKKKWISM